MAVPKVTEDKQTPAPKQAPAPRIVQKAPPAPPPPGELKFGPGLVMLLSLIAFVFLVLAVGLPWYRMEQYAAGPNGEDVIEHFHLWKTVKKVGENVSTQSTHDIPCGVVRYRVRAMQAFSIVNAVFSFFVAIMSVLNFILGRKIKTIRDCTIAALGVTFAVLSVECSINFNVYHGSFSTCGTDGVSYHSRLYEPYVGFAFTVTGWVITGVAGIFSYNDPSIPTDARFVDLGRFVYALLALSAFVLITVASPVPHWYYKDGTNKKVTDVFLWRERYRVLWDTQGPTTSIAVWNLGCDSMARSFHAAASFNIISIFFTALATVTGYLQCKLLVGSTIPALIFGYISVLATLIQWILEVSIFFGSFCDGRFAYSRKKFIISGGFGISVASFVAILLGSIFLTTSEYLRRKYYVSKVPTRTIKEIAIEISK